MELQGMKQERSWLERVLQQSLDETTTTSYKKFMKSYEVQVKPQRRNSMCPPLRLLALAQLNYLERLGL